MIDDPLQEKRKIAFRRYDEFWALVHVLPALRLGALQQNLKKTDIIIINQLIKRIAYSD